MLVDTVEVQYYGDDDALPHSPGLQPIKVKYKPSPTPPPVVTEFFLPPTIQNVSSSLPLSRRQKRANRPKTQPSQGDFVLLRTMEPNRPDIAQQASETALDSDSHTESEDDEMDEQRGDFNLVSSETLVARQTTSDAKSTDLPTIRQVLDGETNTKATTNHRDSVLEDDVLFHNRHIVDRSVSRVSTVSILPNGTRTSKTSKNLSGPGFSLPTTSQNVLERHHGTLTNGQPHRGSMATSPNLQQLSIPQEHGPDTLPALHAPSPAGDSAVSPGQQQQLPGFRTMDDIARSVTSEHDVNRANSFVHRPSISSVGTSPTSIVRQQSISAHSPATPYTSMGASSPMSARDEIQRGDLFLRTSGGGVFGTHVRRPSHAASENGPYPTTLHSASTSESYHSSDSLSPGTQQTPIEGRPRHMSLDGALATRFLPPPAGSGIQHIPSHGSGSFRCDWPGCNAAPFGTQYLLNSHTNVHSQNRPHYCPVKECPRGEGGKGFKRKNEMIRHGLVHQSPGYVCPFCPDREHKYPRPDNLQRHVRVHHVDKDKDDPQLRDVLAQRPEGGSRGRRRRVSDTAR